PGSVHSRRFESRAVAGQGESGQRLTGQHLTYPAPDASFVFPPAPALEGQGSLARLEPQARRALHQRRVEGRAKPLEEVRAFLEDLDGQDEGTVAGAHLEQDRGASDGAHGGRGAAHQDLVWPREPELDGDLGRHRGYRRVRKVHAPAARFDELAVGRRIGRGGGEEKRGPLSCYGFRSL